MYPPKVCTECITRCTYSTVDHGNFDALAHNTLVPQLVDLSHEMRRKGVVAVALAPHHSLCLSIRHVARPADLVIRNPVQALPPHALDGRHFGYLGRRLLDVGAVVELNRRSLEELEVEIHLDVRVRCNLVAECGRVLGACKRKKSTLACLSTGRCRRLSLDSHGSSSNLLRGSSLVWFAVLPFALPHIRQCTTQG